MACCNNCSNNTFNTRNTSCGCGCNRNTRSGSCNNCDFGGVGIFGRRFPLGGLTRFGCGAGGGVGFPSFFNNGFGFGFRNNCGCGCNRSCGCGCNND